MGIIEIESGWCPTLLDLSKLEAAFFFDEGFSRPDWKVIGQAIQQTALPEDLDVAWFDAVLQWLSRVKGDLGGDYRLWSSKEFLLLSALDHAFASQRPPAKPEACRRWSGSKPLGPFQRSLNMRSRWLLRASVPPSAA
jgi:hypothetical protein